MSFTVTPGNVRTNFGFSTSFRFPVESLCVTDGHRRTGKNGTAASGRSHSDYMYINIAENEMDSRRRSV